MTLFNLFMFYMNIKDKESCPIICLILKESLHTVKLSYKELRIVRTFWLKGFFIRELYFPLVIICS